MLRVLSLNAWGGRLHGQLLTYLGTVEADILCLQEVTRTDAAPSDRLVYREGDAELPQRANLLADIAAALPDHLALYAPVARGLLFHGDAPVWSEFGLATFVRRSLTVIGQAQDFVHGDYSPDGWGEHPRARNAHVVRIHSAAHGFTGTIGQMHGLRDVSGKKDIPARLAQAEAFARLIGQVRRAGERIIACGDFNVLPESVTFDVLSRFGLVDLVTGRGHADTRTSWYRKPGRFADYMLTSPETRILRFDVVEEPEISDHRALLLDFA